MRVRDREPIPSLTLKVDSQTLICGVCTALTTQREGGMRVGDREPIPSLILKVDSQTLICKGQAWSK